MKEMGELCHLVSPNYNSRLSHFRAWIKHAPLLLKMLATHQKSRNWDSEVIINQDVNHPAPPTFNGLKGLGLNNYPPPSIVATYYASICEYMCVGAPFIPCETGTATGNHSFGGRLTRFCKTNSDTSPRAQSGARLGRGFHRPVGHIRPPKRARPVEKPGPGPQRSKVCPSFALDAAQK